MKSTVVKDNEEGRGGDGSYYLYLLKTKRFREHVERFGCMQTLRKFELRPKHIDCEHVKRLYQFANIYGVRLVHVSEHSGKSSYDGRCL